MDEAHLPAKPAKAGQDTRLSLPHADQRRSQRHQAPPRQRAEAPDGLRSLNGPSLRSLKGDRAFRRLRRGRSGGAKHLSIRWRTTQDGVVRVGIVVSRKVGKAVVRNRVRRRLWEALRAIVRDVTLAENSFDMIVIVRPAAASADYGQLKDSLLRALQRGRLA